MKLDLTRFRRPFDHVDRTIAAADVPAGSEGAYRAVASVELAFDVHRDKGRIRLDGTVLTQLELACVRCLEPFRLPIDSRFDLRFRPQSDEAATGDQEVVDAEIDTSYYRDDEISLSDLLREQFYLALPMKPLCQEACRGLCSQCGENLNETTCTCTTTWEDPRLAPLRGFGKTRDA
jgi:uncharacterized protein